MFLLWPAVVSVTNYHIFLLCLLWPARAVSVATTPPWILHDMVDQRSLREAAVVGDGSRNSKVAAEDCFSRDVTYSGTAPRLVESSSSATECQEHCLARADCDQFTFVPQTGQCRLYTVQASGK